MREDIETECIRTIERDAVDDSIRFSRRHRWKPLAVDVHDSDAVVLVATRGKRTGGAIVSYLYHRQDGGWVCLGSGGGGDEDPRLPPRPAPGERWFQSVSDGMSVAPRPRWLRSNRVHHLDFQAAEGVRFVQWRGRRRAVAEHGFVSVVWRGRSMPTVELLDGDGDPLDRVGSKETRSPLRKMPWRGRVPYAAFRRFHRDEWFNYAPGRR